MEDVLPSPLAGTAVAWTLSPSVEAPQVEAKRVARLGPSRPIVVRLAALFATDACGGFVMQALFAYWFVVRFHTSVGLLGAVFFVVGVLQTLSFPGPFQPGRTLRAAVYSSSFGRATRSAAWLLEMSRPARR